MLYELLRGTDHIEEVPAAGGAPGARAEVRLPGYGCLEGGQQRRTAPVLVRSVALERRPWGAVAEICVGLGGRLAG